jgi:hypothetical protein
MNLTFALHAKARRKQGENQRTSRSHYYNFEQVGLSTLIQADHCIIKETLSTSPALAKCATDSLSLKTI